MDDRLSLAAIHPPVIRSIEQVGANCRITMTNGSITEFPLSDIPRGPHKTVVDNLSGTPINFGRCTFLYPADGQIIPQAEQSSTYVEFTVALPAGVSGSVIDSVKYRIDNGQWIDITGLSKKKISLPNSTPGPHRAEVKIITNGQENLYRVRWYNGGETQ